MLKQQVPVAYSGFSPREIETSKIFLLLLFFLKVIYFKRSENVIFLPGFAGGKQRFNVPTKQSGKHSFFARHCDKYIATNVKFSHQYTCMLLSADIVLFLPYLPSKLS